VLSVSSCAFGVAVSSLLVKGLLLNLEIAHHDPEKEFVQFKLPSGEILEFFGSKSLWHCFTMTPDWEVIVVDIRLRKEISAPGAKNNKESSIPTKG
jgi:hypothetical protein